MGRRAGVSERARLLPLAEHGPLLRLDHIPVDRATRATLTQPDGEEDSDDAEGEQRLDDGAGDTAVRYECRGY